MIYSLTTMGKDYDMETTLHATEAEAEARVLSDLQTFYGYDGDVYDVAECSSYIGSMGATFLWHIAAHEGNL